MGYWLEKVLGANDDGNNLGKFAPLVIFFVIWLFSAIAKARAGKKGVEEKPTEGKEKHQPSFDDLARKIRERYAAAKEQARRAAEQDENGRLEFPAQAPGRMRQRPHIEQRRRHPQRNLQPAQNRQCLRLQGLRDGRRLKNQ